MYERNAAAAPHETDVPVDPELSNCFNCLEIINDFRFTNDPALIDELIARWNHHTETSSSASYINRNSNDYSALDAIQ